MAEEAGCLNILCAQCSLDGKPGDSKRPPYWRSTESQEKEKRERRQVVKEVNAPRNGDEVGLAYSCTSALRAPKHPGHRRRNENYIVHSN